MMRDALYGGVNAAVLTPMRDDLSIDLDRMAAHCRWLLENGCNGLAVLGTTGEANSLGVAERIAVMEGLVARGIPARVLLPGTGTTAIPDTALLTTRAAELGCRGALLLPPFFYKNPSEDGLFAYYSEVVRRVPVGIALYFYHFPAQSAVPITTSLIARLLHAHPGRFKGVKDSSGDFANTAAYVRQFARDGFEVYCGDDGALHALLQEGGAGCITAATNVGSAVSATVYANWDRAVGAEAQATLAAIRKAVTSVALIPALKSLMARHTGDAAWRNIRPPHGKLDAAAEAKLFAAFDAAGVQLKPVAA
ncbi:MAG: dihydrodipicolinate synthase family protein [Rhodospirillales bacterium]|nr:dihydrodipicolinate synthase family protein [Rhodospirillales bacterium]